jgi:Flp pilus assembly protein TadD
LDVAIELVTKARELRPENFEFSFWTGVVLANAGRAAEAHRWLDQAFAAAETWRELARRLRAVGLFTGDPDLIDS